MKKQISLLLSAMMLSNGFIAPTVFASQQGKSMSSDVILELETGDEESIVEVSVPMQIPIKLSKEGIATVDQSLGIQNLSSTVDVTLKSVQVVGKSSWQIQDFSTDFSSFTENEKKLAMSFKGNGTTSNGMIDTHGGWVIDSSETMLLEAQAKVPAQTEDTGGSIATVNYSFEASSDSTTTPGSITDNWKDKPVLKTSVTPVTFTYNSGTEGVTLTEVKSLNPDIATITAADMNNLAADQTVIYNVTAVSNGTATMEASLSNGEKTTFDVEVYSLNIPGADSSGQGGNVSVTIPGKEPGSSISTGDVVIELPTTSESGEGTVTVTPEIPEDTVLEVGDNTITVVTDIDGVKITINITITIDPSNPSDGLHQSIEEAQAAGFTFSSYNSGLQIDSFENKQFKSEVNIPEQIGDFKVLKIGDNAFKNQSNLKKVTIPSTVTTIGANAFSGCTGFEELLLPSSITSIGNSAFNSTGTTSATGEYHVIVGCNLPNATYSNRFFGNSNITKLTFLDGVSSIGDYNFYQCNSLTEILFPNSLTTIGDSTFSTCNSLKKIILPEGLTTIGDAAFSACNSLREIILPESLSSIGVRAFRGCGSLQEITIPDRVATIGENAFDSCSNLVSVKMPKGVVTIPKMLFYYCTSLMEVTIPNGVTDINNSAFAYCTNLVEITIPESVTNINDGAFAFCTNLKKLVVPNTTTSIGYNAFNKLPWVVYNGSAEGSPWGAVKVTAS